MPNDFQIVAIKVAALLLLMSIACAVNPANAFDRQKLQADGEVYAVALHDTYVAEAKAPRVQSDIARYFESRAKSIENGEEIAPANPRAFPIANSTVSARLEWAYEETADTVTSEAADVEPYLTANVEVAYERWLITMHDDPKATDAETLAAAFDKRLDDLTASPQISALQARREHQVAGRL